MYRSYLLIIILTLIEDLHGFNIQEIRESLLIQPPRHGGRNIDGSTAQFFGYSFGIEPGSSRFRDANHTFVIGAPKAQGEPPADHDGHPGTGRDGHTDTGDVFFCRVSVSANAPPSTCAPSPLGANLAPTNGFGFNLQISPDQSITTCSPYSVEPCDSSVFTPGRCHVNSLSSGSSWTEKRPLQACPSSNIDLIFLLDASGSITAENFELVKNWTKTIAQNFSISRGGAQIGVVKYSHYFPNRELDDQLFITTEIALGSIQNRSLLNASIDRIEVTQFRTYTAHALNKTVMDFQSSHRFSDPTTNKVLVFVTDGSSTDRALLPSITEYVRSQGITSFAVGVGAAAMDELRLIATGSYTNERVYYVRDFINLREIVDSIKSDIRLFVNKGSLIDRIGDGIMNAESGFSLRFSRSGVGNARL